MYFPLGWEALEEGVEKQRGMSKGKRQKFLIVDRIKTLFLEHSCSTHQLLMSRPLFEGVREAMTGLLLLCLKCKDK